MQRRTGLKPSTTPLKRSGTRRERTVYAIQIKGMPCAYCKERPAVNADHVIPRSMLRSYNRFAGLDAKSVPGEWLDVVPACFECNIRKGTRRLVPETWAKRIPAMNRFFGGTPFRVWHGTTSEAAYSEAWK